MKGFIKICTIFIIMIVFLIPKSYCDVGSFESYSGGGGDSYSSSHRDYRTSKDNKTANARPATEFEKISIACISVLIIIGFIVVIVIDIKSDKELRETLRNIKTPEQIAKEIKEKDELFNEEEILAWAKDLFVKLQQAWTKRDWNEIRPFETNELFELHKNQLQGYIDNGTVNVMDRICINYARLFSYNIIGEKEYLTIEINSRMKDYIIDEKTRKVVKGNTYTEYKNTYRLRFERKLGVKTKEGTMKLNTVECPKCGAPLDITLAGKCNYCNSIVTTGEYNWCLAELDRV
ncbi:MAG: Tim44 domain-containing protein [Clostridia bacterium]|nr:Tim44 domain-containing protein [Clostridia bacterium]